MESIEISFHGAAREVTGSCHLVRFGGRRTLLDCGLIQGGRERHRRNRDPFPFDAKSIDRVILSHAHIDHSGRLPLLAARGFSGPVLCTEATARLCSILLPDSAHIQEEDARWTIKRLKKKGKDASWVEPLYTSEDAERLLGMLEPIPFDRSRDLGDGAELTFVRAGHILGAAIVRLRLGERTLVFSGDLGVTGARLIGPPKAVERPDFLLIESTYGNRSRKESGDRTELLFEILDRTIRRGGKLIVPAFAVGRTQEIVARINDLVEARRIPRIPVFVDSPMAVRATKAFRENRASFSKLARELAEEDAPLDFPGLELVTDAEDSRELNGRRDPCVIISASGMCTAGRIKHHLKHNIEDPRNTILFVGYQAVGSLGRLILDGVSPVRIFSEWYDVRAQIERIEGFSAHADREELLAWFDSLGGAPERTFIVHGEEAAGLALASALAERGGAAIEVPRLGRTYKL